MNLQRLIERYISYRQALGEKFGGGAAILRAFGRTVGSQVDIGGVHAEQIAAFLAGARPITNYWHNKYRALFGFYSFASSTVSRANFVYFLSSITITSKGLSPTFSGRCFPASAQVASWALPLLSCDVPSGRLNLAWPSLMNTATEAGCSCITDFSCGPYLARSTRTWSLLRTTL